MTIIIEAKRDGFRRCGIAHPGKPTKYADDFFTEEQLKALAKEPQLICAYEEDEFDQVQDEPNENFPKAALPQAPNAAPATESQAPQTVIAPVDAPVVNTAAPVLGDTVLGSTSDDAAGPLSGPTTEVVTEPVVAPVVSAAEPVQSDAGEPAEKVEPVSEKPARATKAKGAAK